MAVLVALVASVAGLTFGSTVVLSRVDRVSSAEASNDTRTEQPASIELAQALTAAINAHDVDALVELFTEEDAGPTVTAERFAWQKFEIRLWAQRQAEMNIRVEAHDYRLTEHGAAWDTEVYRDDWAALGVKALPVTNSIWVHNGKLANFTSNPGNPGDAERLGNLWRPGAMPERPTS